MKYVYYLTPTSFCRGVERSLKMLDDVIKNHPNQKIYCYHAIVHNPGITKGYQNLGVQFIESLDEIIDANSITVFSAHGVSRAIIDQAQNLCTKVYNLECPLVTKIYQEISIYQKKGVDSIVYIGSRSHQEGKNVVHWIEHQGFDLHVSNDGKDIPKHFHTKKQFLVLSQTTLNYDHVIQTTQYIQKNFTNSIFPPVSDICKATRERQSVIKQHADQFDALIVIGGKESHNTKELALLGAQLQKTIHYGESWIDIHQQHNKNLLNHARIALIAGASTPGHNIKEGFDRFRQKGYEGKILQLDEKKRIYK